VGWPGLDENHVAGHEASGVCAASRIGLTVEDNRAITVGGVSEDLVEKDCESVQVTNVERAEIRMECIVEKGIVNSEVDGRSALGRRGGGLSPSSSLAGRLGLLQRIREWSARGRSRIVRSQVEAICVYLFVVRSQTLVRSLYCSGRTMRCTNLGCTQSSGPRGQRQWA
jgi:hypothetical protein